MKIDPKTVYAVDISMSGAIRVVGNDAPRFVRTMYSGSMEHFDELFGVSQGMFLNAQGEVIDMCGVVRTGDDECLIMCSPDNLGELMMWLQAHAELEDDNGKIFPDVTVEDQSMKLAMMLIYGTPSNVLFDSLKQACADKVFMIACDFEHATYAIPRGPGHLLVVAPNVAPQIGDFLNEALNVEVLQLGEYRDQLMSSGQIAEGLDGAEYSKPQDLGLTSYLRDVHDFVGARALGLE